MCAMRSITYAKWDVFNNNIKVGELVYKYRRFKEVWTYKSIVPCMEFQEIKDYKDTKLFTSFATRLLPYSRVKKHLKELNIHIKEPISIIDYMCYANLDLRLVTDLYSIHLVSFSKSKESVV